MFIAFLRGINVGGKNTLPMKDLLTFFEKAGARDAKNYIQSGNVVFAAASEIAARKIAGVVEKSIVKKFGFASPVIVRSAEALRALKNPYLHDADNSHVVFLADSPKSFAALDAKRSPGDAFISSGSEIFLHCPNGYGRSKLTNAYFDGRLKTTSTVRNWRTVLKLLSMTE